MERKSKMDKRKVDGEAEILSHNYDGIQEFDNPLPNWWLLTFYGAIVFSFFYVGWYHFGPGPSLDQELASDLSHVKALAEAQKKLQPARSEAELLAVFGDPTKREQGKKIFLEKCATCHGGAGEGMIGPNLTDKAFLHGNGSLSSLVKVISEGVPEKGMPPWNALLSEEQVVAAAAHVRGLIGTKPPNPKAPQGTEVKE
jgi:cytochrome c oxidase cbb3-type subunit III